MNLDDVVSCEIHPAIGISRVGNSPTEFFIGPERPGVPPEPDGGFKDTAGRVKRQAARFRVYGYDKDGNVLGELTADDARISWTVELANSKADWIKFLGRFHGAPENTPGETATAAAVTGVQDPRNRRNPGIDVNDPEARARLVIKPGPRTVTGPSQDGGTARFDTGTFLGRPVPLGELRTDDKGRLLVLGGSGHSGTTAAENPITHYANNDYWYDDVSDGPVAATVTLRGSGSGDGGGTSRTLEARSAWVLVGPPDFSPHTTNLVTLYDVVAEAQGYGQEDQVSFTRHIYPILHRISDYQWVNAAALRGHGEGEAGHFTAPGMLGQLATNSPGSKDLRTSVFERLRSPEPNVAEATSEYMPQLAGDDGDPVDGRPLTWMALLPGQYERMRRWAEGDFTADWTGRAPVPGEPALAQEPHALVEAALDACSGGPFYPGIETTYIVQQPQTWSGPFRVREDFAPGDLTKYMALPWQADFYECHTHWWPAQRPDDVYPESHFLALIRAAGDQGADGAGQFPFRQPWARGVGQQVIYKPKLVRGAGESEGAYRTRVAEQWKRIREHAGDNDMVEQWSRLGFVVPRRAPDGSRALVETERSVHVGLSDREWFYTLQHPDRFPEQVKAAREYVRKVLADAVVTQNSPHAPQTLRPFRYTRENLEERLDLIYTQLAQEADAYDAADPRRDPLFRTRESVVERVRQMAPFNLLDGVWLRNITPAKPIDDVHALLFTIWKEEVGDGNPALNHSSLYQNLLEQLGIFLPPVDSYAFSTRPEILDSAYTVPAFELAISLYPEEFFPELLGMTLHLEWEILGVVPMAELLDHHQIDSRFYRMHIGIDNAAQGHGALARDAIMLHLDQMYAGGGDDAVQRQWQRIWNGYVAFQTTGTLGEDIASRLLRPPTVEQRLIRMIEDRAPWAARNHEGKRLGGSYLNDWFADPEGLLRTLSTSEWVTPGDHKRSRLFELFSWNGPMYKVFDEEETGLWREWIDSLGRQPSPPRTFSPLESMVLLTDAMRARPDGFFSDVGAVVGPQPGNPEHLVERPAAWWSLQPTEALLAAVAHPANRVRGESGEEGAARAEGGTQGGTDFVRAFFASVDRPALVEELPVTGTPQDIVDEWVEVGCPLPDPQVPVTRVSLSTPQPVAEPDSPLRVRIHGMGGIH
ncbi:LodA/GoxA family CTQ-dependent oxidase [Streptomyces violaceus]|uniref:LodA/GoxA family CTQ-dependent oxidase n=1 Tax=Streptomyces violaceus TaxID=1936 RepID=UPI003817462C